MSGQTEEFLNHVSRVFKPVVNSFAVSALFKTVFQTHHVGIFYTFLRVNFVPFFFFSTRVLGIEF